MSGFTVPIFTWLYQGVVAAGGSVAVYKTGTTTLVTVYSDGALTMPISNPITLDVNGQCQFYVDGTVNLRMDGYTLPALGGALIKSIDPVYPTGASSGAIIPWAVAGGSADVITAVYSPVITTLTDGLLLSFRALLANATTTPTFAPNGLTARTITQQGGTPLFPGSISANLAEYLVRYNLANTRWELLNPAVSGAKVLLQTQTASSSATIDFTTGITSTYKRYVLEITNMLLASGTSVYLRISTNGGSTWISTASYAYHVGNGTAGAGTYSGVAGTGIAQLNITGPLAPGTAATDGFEAIIDIANPANAATYTDFSINGSAVNASSGNIVSSIKGGGCYAVAAAVNGIRILGDSGNIASGTFKLYGIL